MDSPFIVPSVICFVFIQKDRFMLWIGILALVFLVTPSVLLIPYLPIEIALTIVWFVLFAFTFFAIKKIKNTNGVTFQPDRFSHGNLFVTAEILLASQLGLKPETTVESPMEFGDGGFSGGGSEVVIKTKDKQTKICKLGHFFDHYCTTI
jgi:hypothetical protein